jgi:EAL domain-containing protein (putative c-di-GMP-specific phosphodiesterase class I)
VLWKALAGRVRKTDRVERGALMLLIAVLAMPLTRVFVSWPTWLDQLSLTAGPIVIIALGLAVTRQFTVRPAIMGVRVRRALARGELFLCYQPKLVVESGELEGVEALIRWHHPRFGMLPPSDWIELVERSPFMDSFNHWVLDHAIEQAGAWRAAGTPLRVAVNLSPGCLDDWQLPGRIAAMLERHQVPAAAIELEVTERALERGDAPEVAEQLLALGVRVVLDDFGIGYSSLSRLVNLRFDGVKIDRSFVQDMGVNPRSDAIVSWAAGLARGLGLSLAAEGVETPAALRRLRTLGVASAQGFLVARPLTVDQLDAWRSNSASAFLTI